MCLVVRETEGSEIECSQSGVAVSQLVGWKRKSSKYWQSFFGFHPSNSFKRWSLDFKFSSLDGQSQSSNLFADFEQLALDQLSQCIEVGARHQSGTRRSYCRCSKELYQKLELNRQSAD